jgi:60 kDa SS-A/Ro ribonucleoprotein
MNKDLFKTNPGNVKDADTTNEAGGKAYSLSDKAALSQFALTGTLNNTFYVGAVDQLTKVLELANKVDIEFVARLAVYARECGKMKDMPALLTAFVASKNTALFKQIFPLVINDAKMLRNFMQTIRSNVMGRKSFGSGPKKIIQKMLNAMSDETLFKSNIGNDPSLPDIIKMVHPKPQVKSRNALYAYLIGKKYEEADLFPLARQFEAFKKDLKAEMPNVPFQMLTALELTDDHYKLLARRATWNQLRQNLNNFLRHNAFKDQETVDLVAAKLANPEEVRRARIFPYQLFTTFYNVSEEVPAKIRLAIQSAAEVALENTPTLDGSIYICLDVSGSMGAAVTGQRGSATSKMSCIDVGAMFAAAIVRKNNQATVIPFDTAVRKIDINPMDSVATNAKKLAIHGGGTDCGCALASLNAANAKGSAVVYISDNQSWIQSTQTRHGETPMMREWQKFQERNKGARLVNMDLTPYGSAQVYEGNDVLNVGGFSDMVFDVVASFVNGEETNTVVKKVESIRLEAAG